MQVLAEVRQTFLARLCEWAFACILAMWGFVLLLPVETYENSPAWRPFALLVGEDTLGWLMLLFGVGRLVVLTTNGFWRPMYYLRGMLACFSCAVWTMIALGFISGGVIGVWIATYPILAVFDAVNCFRAMGDAAHMENARRATKPGARHADAAG